MSKYFLVSYCSIFLLLGSCTFLFLRFLRGTSYPSWGCASSLMGASFQGDSNMGAQDRGARVDSG